MNRRRVLKSAHGGPLSKIMRPAEYSVMTIIADAQFALRRRPEHPLDQQLRTRLLRLLDAIVQSPTVMQAIVNPARRRGDRTDGKPLAIAVEYMLRLELLSVDKQGLTDAQIRAMAKAEVASSWSKSPKYVARIVRQHLRAAHRLAEKLRENCKSPRQSEYLRELRQAVIELPHSQPANPEVPVDW